MAIVLNGTTGITNDGGYTGDGVVFADTTPANTLVTTTAGDVGMGTASPAQLLDLGASNTGLTGTDANNTLRFTDTDTSTATNQPLGKIEWYSADATTSARVGAYILATAQGTSGGGNLEFGTATNTGTVTEQMQITASGNLQFNSGYGSVATAYGCRAWVNFNGTGTVAIRDSGNVSSITDNGTGDYTVNFTTAMPDANYAVSGAATNGNSAAATIALKQFSNQTTSAVAINSVLVSTGSAADRDSVQVTIFR